MKKSELKLIIKEAILETRLNEARETVPEIGKSFNHDGYSWTVVKPGKTQSLCKITTKSAAGKTRIIDNKDINK